MRNRVVRIRIKPKSEDLVEREVICSGILWWDGQRVVTANHPFEGLGDGIEIVVDSRTASFSAELAAVSKQTDLALIRISEQETSLGEKDGPSSAGFRRRPVVLGERSYCAGFPFADILNSREPTITSGIISGLDRSVRYADLDLRGLLQCDASASDGFSGGPLLDQHGRLVGMISFIISDRDGTWQGATFCIPLNQIETFLEQHEQEIEDQ